MGRVLTYDVKCPKCELETGIHDSYYKNHEEYFHCENNGCGFSYHYQWKRDENHKLVTIDGNSNYSFDNLIMVETIFEDGKEIITELNQNKDDKSRT
jgi:hypothetical protein